MGSFLRSLLLLTVLVVLCQQGEGRKRLTKQELRELKEIEDEVELYLKATAEKAEIDVAQAISEGIEKEKAFKRKQKRLKNEGVDGKKKKGGRNRLNKVNKKTIEQQEKGQTLLEIKESLLEVTGESNIRDLANDASYRQSWDQLIQETSTEEEKRQSKWLRTKRATDTSVCDTTTVNCDDMVNVDKYRSMSGICNNKNNPLWGSEGSTQRRWLDESYADSISTARVSVVDGSDLPIAREISNAIFKSTEETTTGEGFNTLFSLNWGQFLDHDIVLTPTYTGDDGSDISCCGDESRTECMDIEMTPDEDLDTDCIEVVRSAPAADCELTGKQITNSLTSFIDASGVYGVSEEEVTDLRGTGALLTTKSSSDGLGLLPEDASDDAICALDGNDAADYCQEAGDVRVNVQPGLGSLHLLFVREHNRIVDELKAVKTWEDEDELFNETRKIIGAIIQHVTYNEYFGNLFNDELRTQYELFPLTDGFYTSYDDSVDPGMRVGFTTAAYRFGHSQIPDKLAYMADDYTTTSEETDMENTLKNPHMLIKETGASILSLVRYMNTIEAPKADITFDNSIRNNLFNSKVDLPALNIQRGRDHGLPSYTKFREFCGLSVPAADEHNNWRDMTDLTGTAKKGLKELYKSVHDIDLYAGGMGEKRVAGTYVGNTFACLLGLQFQYLRQGDRFWYEREGPEGFTADQLTEIRRVTLSGLMCANFGLTEVQGNSFKQPNNRRPCSRINQMDFSPWA